MDVDLLDLEGVGETDHADGEPERRANSVRPVEHETFEIPNDIITPLPRSSRF